MVPELVSEIPGAKESLYGDLVEPAPSMYFVVPTGQQCRYDHKVACCLSEDDPGGVFVPP